MHVENLISIILVALLLFFLIGRFRRWVQSLPLRKIEKIVRKLHPGHEYRIHILESEDFNAYADIDSNNTKIIILTKSIIKYTSTEELSFVLAHEVSHHILNHQITRYYRENIADQALDFIRPKGILESIGFSSMKKNPPLWWNILNGLKSIAIAKFSQNDEYEADRLAVSLMIRAGINPYGAISLIEKLNTLNPDRSGIMKLYHTFLGKETHPFNSNRITKIKMQIESVN